MALTTTADVMLALGIQPGPRTSPRYDLLRQQIEQAVLTYAKWELGTASYIDYYDGNSYKDIIVRRPWVTAVENLWLDVNASYGDGPNDFPASTLQTLGTDYSLVRDYAAPNNDGTANPSKSGLLRRKASPILPWPSDWVFGGNRRSGLSYVSGPCWPFGFGIIKVQYAAGFSVVPDDIKLAVETGVGIAANSTKYGFPAQSEGLGAYNYSLAISREPEFTQIRQLLSRYRDLAL